MKSRRTSLLEEGKENIASSLRKTPRTPRTVRSMAETPLKSESSRRTRNTSMSAVKSRSVKSETKSRKQEVTTRPTRKSARFLKLIEPSDDSKSDIEEAVNSTFTYKDGDAAAHTPKSTDEDAQAPKTPKTRKSRKRGAENASPNGIKPDISSSDVKPEIKPPAGESQASAPDADGTFLVEPGPLTKSKPTRKSKARSRSRRQNESNSGEYVVEAQSETPTSDEEAHKEEVKNKTGKSKKRKTKRVNSRKTLGQQEEDVQYTPISSASATSEHESVTQETESDETTYKENVTNDAPLNILQNVEENPNLDPRGAVQNQITPDATSVIITAPKETEVEEFQTVISLSEQNDIAPDNCLQNVEIESKDEEAQLNRSVAVVEENAAEIIIQSNVEDSLQCFRNSSSPGIVATNIEQVKCSDGVPRTSIENASDSSFKSLENHEEFKVDKKDSADCDKPHNASEEIQPDDQQTTIEHINTSRLTNGNVSLEVNTTKDLTPGLEDLEKFFDDKTLDTNSKNRSCDEGSVICQMDESVISVDSFSSIISLPETPRSEKKGVLLNSPLKTPITVKNVASKPKSLTKTPLIKWSNTGSATKGVKRLQTPSGTPLIIGQNRSRSERDKTPFAKGGISAKGSSHSISKISSKKLALIVKEAQTPKEVPAEPKVLKSIRKRSMSYSDVELVKSAAKSKVTFHSPSNLTIPIEDIDKSLMVYQKSGSKRIENTSPNRKRTFSVSQIPSGAENFKTGTSPYRKRTLSVSQISSGGKNLKICGSGETPTKLKKLEKQPSRTKMPNFSAIHKQNFDKMESIFDHIKKKEERAKALSATKSKSDSLHQSSKKIDSTIKGNKKENEPNPKARQKINLTHITVNKKDSSHQKEVTKHSTDVLKPIALAAAEKKVNSQPKELTKLSTEDFKPIVEASVPLKNIEKTSVEIPKHTAIAIVKPLINPEKKVDKVTERRKKHEAMLKSRTRTADGTANQNVEFVKGIRSNRRFELQMLHRNKQ